MLNLFTLCLDLLLYMSIIISVEREISKELIQGIKEMKDKVFISNGIVSMGIYREIDYLQDYRGAFRHEFIKNNGIDFDCYLTDMICDGYNLTSELLKYRRCEIPTYLIDKINKWYSACENLVVDVHFWLKNDCNINNSYEVVENYKAHRLVRKLNVKEGK